MELRPTTVGDFPGLHALFLEAIAGVYVPHGFVPPAPPLAVFAGQQRHIIESGGRSIVAVRGTTLTGFASAWRRDDDWFLASLFVAPTAQGRGVGRALLASVWDGHCRRRRTVTDAIQPVSNALYARHGLVPATPVLSFSGLPRAGAAALTEGDGDLAPLDAASYGFDRAVDHAYWSGLARRTVWMRAGRPVAYSYAWPSGHIGPVAGVDPEAAASALDGELGRAGGSVVVRVPGSARLLVEVALQHGLELSATPGLLLLSGGVDAPTMLALSGFALF